MRRTAPSGGSDAVLPDVNSASAPSSTVSIRGELRRGEDVIRLTERERDMLNLLGRRLGGHVRREELAGAGASANERTVDVQINRLRRKIENDPANPVFLQTVRGIGYRLICGVMRTTRTRNGRFGPAAPPRQQFRDPASCGGNALAWLGGGRALDRAP